MSGTADFSMPVRLPTLAEELVNYWYVMAIVLLAGFFIAKKRMGAAKKK